jgi:hypothetical protein
MLLALFVESVVTPVMMPFRKPSIVLVVPIPGSVPLSAIVTPKPTLMLEAPGSSVVIPMT